MILILFIVILIIPNALLMPALTTPEVLIILETLIILLTVITHVIKMIIHLCLWNSIFPMTVIIILHI